MKHKNTKVIVRRRFFDGTIREVVKDVAFAVDADKREALCPECRESVRLHREAKSSTRFDHYEHFTRGGAVCSFKTEEAV